MLRETSSDIVSFMEYPVYSNVQLYSDLIPVTFFLICYSLPKVNVQKQIFPEILGASQKNQCYCFFRGAQCIAISECILSWFYFFYFDFPLFTKIVRIKVVYYSTFFELP